TSERSTLTGRSGSDGSPCPTGTGSGLGGRTIIVLVWLSGGVTRRADAAARTFSERGAAGAGRRARPLPDPDPEPLIQPPGICPQAVPLSGIAAPTPEPLPEPLPATNGVAAAPWPEPEPLELV